jgi:hypothetical protein
MLDKICIHLASKVYAAEQIPVGALPVDTGMPEAEYDLGDYVATIIQWALGITGTLFLLLMIYGAYTYMTAGASGDSKKAVNIMTFAVIGLIILFAAWIVSQYVISAVVLDGAGAGA